MKKLKDILNEAFLIKKHQDKNNMYVNLGLPSGNNWAKYNLGATSETDHGLLFQWGRTKGFVEYSDIHKNDYDKGLVSGKNTPDTISGNEYKEGDELSKVDDAASVILGSGWSTPSYDDFEELLDNTTYKFVNKYEDIKCNGVLFKSNINNEELFMPCTCVFYGSSGSFDIRKGVNPDETRIWCRTSYNDNMAYQLSLTKTQYGIDKITHNWKRNGCPIRPIYK